MDLTIPAMSRLRMRSLLAELDHPAVGAFLDAVDVVMNSNTLLLKVHADAPVDRGNRAATLAAFLRGGLFDEMMLAADRMRGWGNLDETSWQQDEPQQAGTAGVSRSLVRADFRLDFSQLDFTAMVTRLRWMLTGACSPYRRHLAVEHAQGLVTNFLQQVISPPHGPALDEAGQVLDEAGQVLDEAGQALDPSTSWEFCALKPDFLRTVDHDAERSWPAYFEGCEHADTATFFYRDEIFYLLLTNGAP